MSVPIHDSTTTQSGDNGVRHLALMRMAFSDQLSQDGLDSVQVSQPGAHVVQSLRGQFRRLAAMGAILQHQ
ncbi:hypothetical protein [Vibrio parahaemolyticus]|uniref:hypothetical protein n=1 Tax=Vibrio parahaemolyticus TaxID=670 RepID=UPI002B22029D|nr:hypothetical protein [Vibrio parahaemolyticus]MEA5376657.1 hypothetical protein [Vibrio parahaemolyticus]